MKRQSSSLSTLGVKELLQLESAVITELTTRGVVRTQNKPLGDVAEYIVLTARGGSLEPNSTKSHDITDPQGKRLQVKAMTSRRAGRSGKFSSFRSFDFDTAVFVIFEAGTLDLAMEREVPASEVESIARYSPHTNGRQPTLRQIERLGIDVTEEMRGTFEALNGITANASAIE